MRMDDETPRTRDAWIECGGGPAALYLAMEKWAADNYGGMPWPLDTTISDLLDLLADAGYRVEPINAPALDTLLPASKD